jgi:23S rRNA pseudouridine2605 synthase
VVSRTMTEQKIQLILRDAGLGSRRDAEQMIRDGRVTLNGAVVTEPAVVADPEKDYIKLDGKRVRPPSTEKVYYLFHKPRFVVSTMEDPEGRPCLKDYMKGIKGNLFPIGRLDFDAEGLMILTNDGALAQKLSHPSNQIPRTYYVKVRGVPDERSLARIRRGMDIGEGDRIGEVQWSVIRKQKTSTWIRIVLYEGKKNELKRIFFRVGHPARKIRRISFGPFTLGGLDTGRWRPFTPSESTRVASLVRTR